LAGAHAEFGVEVRNHGFEVFAERFDHSLAERRAVTRNAAEHARALHHHGLDLVAQATEDA